MNALRVVTVDDEPLAIRRLEIVLGEMAGVQLVGSAGNCDQAVAMIAALDPDVVLLDIRLRDGSGFDILARLPPGVTPAVIFTTAFDHFAIRAFEISAVDYVLKPIEAARLAEALGRARLRLAADRSAEQIEEMRTVIRDLRAEFHDNAAPARETELWVRGVSGNLTRIAIDLIDWVSSEEDYVRLHIGGSSHLLRLSIRAFEARVEPAEFVRVHRSALVRISRITEIRRSISGKREVTLRDGTRIPTGRVYAKRLNGLLRDRRA
ncbi:MAG: LytTR family DNA-binding domain-containing protein [Sphingomonas sp.]